MVDVTQAIQQIRRLSGMRGYPKEEGQRELSRVAVENARDSRHLETVIKDFVDHETDCPRPAALRQSLQSGGPAKEDDRWMQHRVCQYGDCCGDGWAVRYALHTRGSGRLHREMLTEDQYLTLKATKLPATQVLYEGVEKCRCEGRGGGRVRPDSDSAAGRSLIEQTRAQAERKALRPIPDSPTAVDDFTRRLDEMDGGYYPDEDEPRKVGKDAAGGRD